jgi:hypothetical protein
MHAKVRAFHSPDVPDLQAYVPPDPTSFGFLVQILVGPHDGKGEESFDVIVCTPGWLAQRYEHDRLVLLHAHVLVQEYRYEYIDRDLRARVETTSGATWTEIATKLARFAGWEFDGYQEVE